MLVSKDVAHRYPLAVVDQKDLEVWCGICEKLCSDYAYGWEECNFFSDLCMMNIPRQINDPSTLALSFCSQLHITFVWIVMKMAQAWRLGTVRILRNLISLVMVVYSDIICHGPRFQKKRLMFIYQKLISSIWDHRHEARIFKFRNWETKSKVEETWSKT